MRLWKNVNKNYCCNKTLFKGIIIYMQMCSEITTEDALLSQATLTVVSEMNLSKGVRGIIRKHLASSIWVLGNIQVQMDTALFFFFSLVISVI